MEYDKNLDEFFEFGVKSYIEHILQLDGKCIFLKK